MDNSLNKKIETNEKVLIFLKKNKLKFFIFFTIIIVFLSTLYWIKNSNSKENILLSEKFIKGRILLAEEKEEEAKRYFEKIVENGNDFYSLLALNTILENKLVKEQEKILKYFKILENKNLSSELSDLLLFKKALYLIKINEKELGQTILSNLIKENSKLKILAQEIISK